MKKRIIQINGISGILMTLFIITCLFAGFVIFPAFVSMYLWNFIAEKLMINSISFIGGLLLWSIIVLCFIIFNKKHLVVSFGIPNNISKEELSEIFKKVECENPEEILKEFENKNQQNK